MVQGEPLLLSVSWDHAGLATRPPRTSGRRRTKHSVSCTKVCAARLQAVIRCSTLFTGNSIKTSDASGTGSPILAEIQPGPVNQTAPTNKCGSSMNIGCWTCLSMLTGQTEVEGGHALEAGSLGPGRERHSRGSKRSSPMGGASSLSCGMRMPHLNLHPRTSVSPPLPSQVRRVNAKGGEALPGAGPHFLARTASRGVLQATPKGRPGTRRHSHRPDPRRRQPPSGP